MMVIQGTIGTVSNGIWPADRCSWTFSAITTGGVPTGGYELDAASFYPGANAPVGGNTANVHTITDPVLGQIGKSGRFVAFTN